MSQQFFTCRLCSDTETWRPMFRYGIRHYCHAECGLRKFGDSFIEKIPQHEIGNLPYRVFTGKPERLGLARKLCPEWIREAFDALQKANS